MLVKEIAKLSTLDFAKQTAFAYLTSERLYPNYVYFTKNYGFGNFEVIRKAIDFLYDNLFENKPNKYQIDSHIQAIEKNTPDTENFDVIFVSSALDCCTCVLDSLDFLLTHDFSKIEFISSYGIDTVDMYTREIEGIVLNKSKNYQENFTDFPLIKREVSIQLGIITFLCNTRSINYDDIQTLLLLQDNDEKGSLGL